MSFNCNKCKKEFDDENDFNDTVGNIILKLQ